MHAVQYSFCSYLSPDDYPDHNTVVYLASDVHYPTDGVRSCSSDFPRLRGLQVNLLNLKVNKIVFQR